MVSVNTAKHCKADWAIFDQAWYSKKKKKNKDFTSSTSCMEVMCRCCLA